MRFAGNKIFVVLASVLVGANAFGAVAGTLTAVNIYALAEINRQLRTNLITRSSRGKREMFFKCCGSSSVASQFAGGIGAAGIVASWIEDVTRFKGKRSQYLLY